MAVRLAGLGHSVVLCDVSEEMLAKAAVRAAEAGVADAIEMRHLSIQGYADIAARAVRSRSVSCSPGVARRPEDCGHGDLARLVKPGGQLSVMFYNRFASLLKRTLAGDFEAALGDYQTGPIRRGWGEGATALDYDDGGFVARGPRSGSEGEGGHPDLPRSRGRQTGWTAEAHSAHRTGEGGLSVRTLRVTRAAHPPDLPVGWTTRRGRLRLSPPPQPGRKSGGRRRAGASISSMITPSSGSVSK